jgi:hypothetical protein
VAWQALLLFFRRGAGAAGVTGFAAGEVCRAVIGISAASPLAMIVLTRFGDGPWLDCFGVASECLVLRSVCVTGQGIDSRHGGQAEAKRSWTLRQSWLVSVLIGETLWCVAGSDQETTRLAIDVASSYD